MAHDVFISYAIEDQLTAEKMCEALEGNGIRCWRAPRDVPFGVDYEEAIVDAISESRLVVLILSSHSNNSPHVKREIQNACAGDEVAIPILPVRVENITLNKALRYYLSSAQWLDASTPPIESHLQRLVEQLRARLGITAPVETAHAAPVAAHDSHVPPAESAPDDAEEAASETAQEAVRRVVEQRTWTSPGPIPPVPETLPETAHESTPVPETAPAPTDDVAPPDVVEPPSVEEKPVAVEHTAPPSDDGPRSPFLYEASPTGAGRFEWPETPLNRTLLIIAASFVILAVGMVAVYQNFSDNEHVGTYVANSVGVSLVFLFFEGLVTYLYLKNSRPNWLVLCGIIVAAVIGLFIVWHNYYARDATAEIRVNGVYKATPPEPVRVIVELRDRNGGFKGREEISLGNKVVFSGLDPGNYRLSATPSSSFSNYTTALNVDHKHVEMIIELQSSPATK